MAYHYEALFQDHPSPSSVFQRRPAESPASMREPAKSVNVHVVKPLAIRLQRTVSESITKSLELLIHIFLVIVMWDLAA